jgi:CRISPR-associated protein Csx14
MAEASIPVDLLNPGQVFACLGFVEAADQFLGGAEGVFDWSDPADVRFRVRARGDESPIEHVLAFLDVATARAVAPEGSASLEAWKASWGEPPASITRAHGYPYPDGVSPATLVCALSDGRRSIRLDHWGDKSGRDNVKFWAGMGGYPGAALARDALALVRGEAARHAADPFAFGVPQSSSFRLDWRRDYVPIDAGFSLNEHGHMTTVGYPLVEILGVIGLSHARPRRPEPRNKLAYIYGVCGRAHASDPLWLTPPMARAALGASPLPLPLRRFRMLLDWPGQEGQARSITTVTEETTA